MKSTAECVLDGEGEVVHECAMKTHPTETSDMAAVGMETGAMSVRLSGGLRRLG